MIYEFITPSDPITFEAENDMIAFLISLLVGEGKAGCKPETGEKINTMTAFYPEIERKEIYKKYCHTDDLNKCFDENMEKISEGLLSFAYGNFKDRRLYDAAIKAITDPEKLEEFKKLHEDENRTSTSRWVQYAWNMGKELKQK